MTRVALYMRCSTDEQAIEGLSIEGQRSVLRLYCKAKELEIVDEYVDEGGGPAVLPIALSSSGWLPRPNVRIALGMGGPGDQVGPVCSQSRGCCCV